jgi:putative ABC transport system ATP-binding protein
MLSVDQTTSPLRSTHLSTTSIGSARRRGVSANGRASNDGEADEEDPESDLMSDDGVGGARRSRRTGGVSSSGVGVVASPGVDATGGEPGVLVPDQNDIIIRAVNVHKTYLLGLDGVPALRGVNVSIARGEFVVILGKSGGGKTSMLNIMGTIDRPSKGELYIAQRRITSATSDDEFSKLRLRHLGFVFQQFNLISTMTALENVALPMVLDGRLNRDDIDKRAQFLLDKVGIGRRSSHLPSQLSGGEQQRVTIARAISNCPDILLLDEPTGDLDTKNSHIILSLLVELNRREGITCIMVTHDNDLQYYAHRVIHMMDGKILRQEVIPQQVRDAQDARLRSQLEADKQDTRQLQMQTHGVTELRQPELFYSALRPVQAEGNRAADI